MWIYLELKRNKLDICDNFGGFPNNEAGWKKPVTKGYTAQDYNIFKLVIFLKMVAD
jgi:hypothetical protein